MYISEAAHSFWNTTVANLQIFPSLLKALLMMIRPFHKYPCSDMVGGHQDPDLSIFELNMKWCRVVKAQKGDFVSPFGKTKLFQEANVRSFDARPQMARQRPVIDVI